MAQPLFAYLLDPPMWYLQNILDGPGSLLSEDPIHIQSALLAILGKKYHGQRPKPFRQGETFVISIFLYEEGVTQDLSSLKFFSCHPDCST